MLARRVPIRGDLLDPETGRHLGDRGGGWRNTGSSTDPLTVSRKVAIMPR